MSYPFYNTPSVRVYSRDKATSIVAAFDVTAPGGFGSPGEVAIINQHRFMIYFYIPEHEVYIVLAYLSTIWGDYPSGFEALPTDVFTVQEVLSFNSSLSAVRQLTTPLAASYTVTTLTDDNWPDYVGGDTVDTWSAPADQFCGSSCYSITADQLEFAEIDFSPMPAV